MWLLLLIANQTMNYSRNHARDFFSLAISLSIWFLLLTTFVHIETSSRIELKIGIIWLCIHNVIVEIARYRYAFFSCIRLNCVFFFCSFLDVQSVCVWNFIAMNCWIFTKNLRALFDCMLMQYCNIIEWAHEYVHTENVEIVR